MSIEWLSEVIKGKILGSERYWGQVLQNHISQVDPSPKLLFSR